MQIIDYVIIAIAVISLIVGLIRGFISQILVLLGIVAISVGTSYLFKFPMQWLSGLITNEKALSIVSIVITAIAFIKALDKLLGGVFGVVVAYAIVAIFVEAMTRTDIGFLAKISELLAPQTENSVIIKSVYSNNFFGKWIFDVIGNAITQLFPKAVV